MAMVIYTTTKKRILRVILIVLTIAAVLLIAVFAVFGSVTASADSGKKPVMRVERGDNKISLTFNCAWDTGDIDGLLGKLSDCGAAATFFVTGEFCDAHPDAVRKMSSAGHSVQNLTDKNIHIKGMNINDLIDDIKSASQKIRTLTGKEPSLIRAPFGDWDDKTLTTVEGMGLRPVQWTADSRDLDDPDAVSVKKRVLDGAGSGVIVLFHNDCPVTEDVLPALVTELKQRGLELVRTEDLLFSDNCFIDENGVQQYRPAVSASLPIIYSESNADLDSAFEKIRMNLTVQEIYDLSSIGKVRLIDKIKSFLSDAEIYAVREASYNELTECYLTLVYAAEHYGAGGTYTDPQYEEIPQIISISDDEDEADAVPDTVYTDDSAGMTKDGQPEDGEAQIVK
ncbi:MAG: polysaccharide deacetylase family protein [Ruminiclostridium sp.]|nr:polysaccharide deacetylase family protein [Ruminiclostridium sp.]